MRLAALVGLAAASLALSEASAATLSNIRIARHPDHVRIVLDLDAPIAYSAVDGAFTLSGLESESAVLNAAVADAPLKRVVIAPATGGARLSFETASPVTTKAFALTPDKDGGHRLVVDLFPAAEGSAPDGRAAVDQSPSGEHPALPAASGTSAALPSAVAQTPMARQATSAAVPGMPIDQELEAAGVPAASPIAAGPGYSQETLRAERALDRGDAKEACTLADSALKTNPKDLRAQVVLGGCRLAQQDGAGAKAAYLSALAQDPSYDRARIGLATAEDMMGNELAARAELSKVLGHEVPSEELARLVDAFKTLRPAASTASSAVAPTPAQRIVSNRAPAIVRGPTD